jgi:hypothetical protein
VINKEDERRRHGRLNVNGQALGLVFVSFRFVYLLGKLDF